MTIHLAGIEQRFLAADDSLRQPGHPPNQVGSLVDFLLAADSPDDRFLSVKNDDAQPVTANEQAAVICRCVGHIARVETFVELQNKLLKLLGDFSDGSSRACIGFGLPLLIQVATGVARHLLDKLQKARASLGWRIVSLKDLDDTDNFFVLLQRCQNKHVFGRQLKAGIGWVVSARLAVGKNFVENFLVYDKSVRILVEARRRQSHF